MYILLIFGHKKINMLRIKPNLVSFSIPFYIYDINDDFITKEAPDHLG